MAVSHHTPLVSTASALASPRLSYPSAVSRLSSAHASSLPIATSISAPLRISASHGTATAPIPLSRRVAHPAATAARGPLRCARRRLAVAVRSAKGDAAGRDQGLRRSLTRVVFSPFPALRHAFPRSPRPPPLTPPSPSSHARIPPPLSAAHPPPPSSHARTPLSPSSHAHSPLPPPPGGAGRAAC
ncbi:unnamed protein product [Closterium sp. Naga37s-1]|nr:unnamed protein product [Closterium sp. Naga37s-1]